MTTKTKEPLTTTDVATKLGTDGRTLRRFLRATDQGVGQGGRYAIDPKAVPGLKKQFAAWREAAEADKAKAKKPDHTCPVCDKSLKSASGLTSHLRSHSASDREVLAPETLTDEEREELARLEAENN